MHDGAEDSVFGVPTRLYVHIFSVILQEKETKTVTPEQTEEKTPQMLRKEVSAIQKVLVIKILKMFLNNLD